MHFSAIIMAFFLAGFALAENAKRTGARLRVATWNIAANIDAQAQGGKPWWEDRCKHRLFKSSCRKSYAIDLLGFMAKNTAAPIFSLQRVDYAQLDDILDGLSRDFGFAGQRVKEQNDLLEPIDGYMVEDMNPILYQTDHLVLLESTSQWLSGNPKLGDWKDSIKGENTITVALFKDLRTDHVFVVANSRLSDEKERSTQEIDIAFEIIDNFRATANKGRNHNASVIFTCTKSGSFFNLESSKAAREAGFKNANGFDGSLTKQGPDHTCTTWKDYDRKHSEDEIWVGHNHDLRKPTLEDKRRQGKKYRPYWFMRPLHARIWYSKQRKGPLLSDHRPLQVDIRLGYMEEPDHLLGP